MTVPDKCLKCLESAINSCNSEEVDCVIKILLDALAENQRYKSIGTILECRSAVEYNGNTMIASTR